MMVVGIMQQQHYLHKHPSGLVVPRFADFFRCANDYMGGGLHT